MIEVRGVSKSFREIKAVDKVSFTVKEQSIFGLIGTNGAGKSTMLRLLAGVLKADEGEIFVDNEPVYDNVAVKRKVYFIADEPYFFSNAHAQEMEIYLSTIFHDFKRDDFYTYLENFQLEKRRKINTFSKGMKKQLALICGICANTKYLLCDETFDGLDPVMKQGAKSIFAKEMESRGLTPIIASHNLRELEDVCDHVGLLHRGGILLSRDLEEMKGNVQKIQCVFKSPEDEERLLSCLEVKRNEKRGSLCVMTINGNREEVMAAFASVGTNFYEVIPLSLEEIFISETEVAGYDVKKLILG